MNFIGKINTVRGRRKTQPKTTMAITFLQLLHLKLKNYPNSVLWVVAYSSNSLAGNG